MKAKSTNISAYFFSIMILLDRLIVNLQHSCSVNEHKGSLLLEKHHVIQLGCFAIDLTYSAENAAYEEIH